MTEPVYILGGWQSDFAERAGEGGFYQLLESATLGALEDSGLMPADIEVAHLGNLAGELTSFQAQLGGLLVSIDPAFNGLPFGMYSALKASFVLVTVASFSQPACKLLVTVNPSRASLIAGAKIVLSERAACSSNSRAFCQPRSVAA